MPNQVLDQFGRIAVYGAGGTLYQRDAADGRMRPRPRPLFDDYINLLSPQRWKELLSECRHVASKGQVAAAIWQKADYVAAGGFRPYFTGEDMAWGEKAEQLLHDTEALCCTRGDRFPWRSIWRLSVPARASDGGFFLLLTSNADGWPLLQPIEAHRIGQRSTGPTVVGQADAWTMVTGQAGAAQNKQKGLYAGLKIVNGIIYNRQGQEVAYRVLGATSADDEDISARDMVHVGAPRWYSEGRPLPEIAPALLDLLGIELSRTAQLDGQIIDAKLTVIETNQQGIQNTLRNALNPPPSGPTPLGTNPELVERGSFRYVKANGGDIKAYESKRPSGEWMDYDDKMSAASIAAIGWRIEMLDPSELGGAAVRGFQDQINTTILNCFEDARPAAVRSTRYRVAKFIQLGQLEDHPEFMKWDIPPPPEFSVDRGQLKAELDGVRTGAESMPDIHRRLGHRSRAVLVAQAKYEKAKDEVAEQYDLDPTRLGTLSIPGDKTGYTPAGPQDPDYNNDQPAGSPPPDQPAGKRKKSKP